MMAGFYSSDFGRLTEQEMQDTVLGTLTVIESELANSDTEQAEQSLDWAVQTLLDHTWSSAAWDLIDQYKDLYERYTYGQ
jgi:hypothetical protein